MKKIGLFLCSVLVAVCSIVVPHAGTNTSCVKASTNKTPIDMYLIGGQSNAAGYSVIRSNPTETFKNVAYSGITDVNFRNGMGESISTSALDYSNIKWQVTGGLGADSTKIGPEYGMAKVLNEYYTGDKKAIIFKTAAGGTSLLDKTIELSEKRGNWYPRSLWEEGYKPDITQNIVGNDPTGLLYEFFVENFKKVYNGLVDNGYEPQIKGMVWMQGETDIRGDYEQYGNTLKTFISDIREDIFKITNDEQTKAMPFVIGKIAPSFSAWNNVNVPKIQEQQERVANEVGGVATVSTDDLIIVREDGTINGTDRYHFNFQDAFKLGCRFAEKAVELSDMKYVEVTAINGKLTYEFDENDDTRIKFFLTPDEHHKLKRITVNGKDETSNVSENCLIVISDKKRTTAEVEFVKKEKYKITYEMDEENVGIVNGNRFVYEGETAEFTFGAREGYKIIKISVNGVEIDSEKTGEYFYGKVENVSGELNIAVEIEKIAADKDTSQNSAESGEGCNGAINISPAWLFLLGIGFIFFAVKRSKIKI